MRGRNRFLSFGLFFYVFLCFINCGGVGGSAAGGGSGSGISDLSDIESSLYEDGYASLPAPIAKLETPDATKLTIVADAVSSSENLPQNLRLSVTDPTVAYVITGSAGAVQDPATTPFVYLENATNGAADFCSVDSDGSFTCAILGDLADDLRLYASTTNDLTTTLMSPPLFIMVNSLGVTTIGMTNSALLSTTFSSYTDSSGNYYLVIVNNGLATVVRRNVSGSLLEVLLEDSSIIPTMFESVSSSFVIFYDQNGQLYELQISGSSSSMVSGFLARSTQPQYAVAGTLTEVTALNDDLSTGDPSVLEGYRLQIIYNEDDATIPTHLIAYHPKSVSSGEAYLGAIFQVNTSSGVLQPTTAISDDYLIPSFGLETIRVSYSTTGGGIGIITDASVEGCEVQCRGEIIRDLAHWDDEAPYPDMGILSLPEGFSGDNITQVLSDPYDTNFSWFVADGGLYRFSNYQSLVKQVTTKAVQSVVVSNDGEYVLTCVDGKIYGHGDEGDILMWEEDDAICDADSPPDIDTNNNVYFYDARGNLRGLYQTSNSDLFAQAHRRNPRALGACEYEVTDTLNQTNWDDFCPCWFSFNDHDDLDPDSDCDAYYQECVAQGKTADMGDCFYYLRSAYSNLNTRY